MNFVQYMLAFLVLYVCIYALINRVCQCIEHCATARAYSKFRENGVLVKMDDVEAGIIKSKKEKDNVILTLAAIVVLLIAIAFFVAWIAWRSGAPLPS